MITTGRTFVNKTGTTYNAARTQTIFAEDMNLLNANDEDLQDQIDNLDFATDAEVAAAVAVETAARIADVNAEEAARISDVNAEEAARISADNSLQSQIDALAHANYGSLRVLDDTNFTYIPANTTGAMVFDTIDFDVENEWYVSGDNCFVPVSDGYYKIGFAISMQNMEKGYEFVARFQEQGANTLMSDFIFLADGDKYRFQAECYLHLTAGFRYEMTIQNNGNTDIESFPDYGQNFFYAYRIS